MVWEGWRRETSPYPDQSPSDSARAENALERAVKLHTSSLQNSQQPSKTKKRPARGRLLSGQALVASAAIAADHGAHGVVRAEILRAVDIEQGGEF